MRPLSRGRFIAGCASAALAANAAAARAATGTFATLAQLRVHRAEVHSLHVYELSPTVRTRFTVTPGELEIYPGVHLTVHHDQSAIDATIQALVTSSPETSGALFDARWGLVYFGRGAVRLFSAYTDILAAQGALGSRRVEFNNPIPLLAALRDAAHS